MPQLLDEWVDLNASQRDILVTLALRGPSTGTDVHLARGESHDTRSVTTRQLAQLRSKGLLASRADPDDDRVTMNYLTPAGRDAIAGAAETLTSARNTVLENDELHATN